MIKSLRYYVICLLPVLLFSSSCSNAQKESQVEQSLTYEVARFENAPVIDANWNKKEWTDVDPLAIDNFMGDQPEHFPKVKAKIAYDREAIYVIFNVEDQYVKAIHKNHQDPVYKDSCVEFFFSPGESSEGGYFNLEMNCGGKMLFHHQEAPRTGNVNISPEDIEQVKVAHSLPELVEPEIQEPTTWTVEYRIPFSILWKYHQVSTPGSGTTWRANFYKCADGTSHPHWLTWSPIDFPRPNFHVPEYFGNLEFVD